MRVLVDKRVRPWLTRIALSLGAALLIILFVQDAVLHFHFFDRLKLSFIDKAFIARGALPHPKDSLDVVLVTISDKSEATLPHRFPFPRSYYARAIRNLTRGGVKAIGIDLTFEQPDGNGKENDVELFKTIRTFRNVVVAGKTDIRTDEATLKRAEENYHTIFYPADSSVGVVFVPNDEDGIYRRYMPFAKAPGEEKFVPTFAFALLNKYIGLPSTNTAAITPSWFAIGDRRVPKIDDVSMLINYYGLADRTFKHIDIANVLDDKDFKTVEEITLKTDINSFDDPDYGLLNDNTFKDKVVLIGPTFSESKDIFPVPIADPETPDKNLMYGVEIHANALQTLIRQSFISRVSPWSEAAYIVVTSLLTFLVVSTLKHIKMRFEFLLEILALVFAGAEIYVILLIANYAFSQASLLIPVVTPIAAVLANYVGSAVYQYLTERKQKVAIKGMFSQYLNPHVVNELIAHPEKLQLGGERKELTVLFSDIAGFSTFSENLEPEQLVHILNEYLSAMTETVLNNDGTLDKYEGDLVMAFWGAPIELDNNALHACVAAVEMQERLVDIRRRWREQGRPDVFARIGINTGPMVVGNMGGIGKFDYTVMGDSVNLGSRLEGANKQYGTKIMISERTQELVKDVFVLRELDLIIVKGKTKPVRVFELVGRKSNGVSGEQLRVIDHFHRGLDLYRQKKFADAIKSFTEAQQVDPHDGPSKLYIERSQLYITTPPPDDWDGVFVMKTK